MRRRLEKQATLVTLASQRNTTQHNTVKPAKTTKTTKKPGETRKNHEKPRKNPAKPGETRKNPAKPGETPRKSTAPTRMDQQIRDNPPAKPGAPRDAPDLVPGLPPGQNLALRTASRGTRDHQLGTRGPPAPPSGGCPRPVPGLILGSQACPDPPSGGVPRPPRPNSRPNSVSQACPRPVRIPPQGGGGPPRRGGSTACPRPFPGAEFRPPEPSGPPLRGGGRPFASI